VLQVDQRQDAVTPGGLEADPEVHGRQFARVGIGCSRACRRGDHALDHVIGGNSALHSAGVIHREAVVVRLHRVAECGEVGLANQQVQVRKEVHPW
jgi:hypothetical protein